MRKLLLLLCFLSQPAYATVVNPSGHDDTAAIQAVCNAGNIVELVRGTYHVSSVTCKDITGKSNGDPYFYYEGQTATINVVGSAGPRGAIVCPAGGACAYSAFNVQPGPGSAGFVMDNIIECPMHNGRFDYRTGEAKGAPACINLKTYPVKVESGTVFIDLG